jgi:hypothetical protein
MQPLIRRVSGRAAKYRMPPVVTDPRFWDARGGNILLEDGTPTDLWGRVEYEFDHPEEGSRYWWWSVKTSDGVHVMGDQMPGSCDDEDAMESLLYALNEEEGRAVERARAQALAAHRRTKLKKAEW